MTLMQTVKQVFSPRDRTIEHLAKVRSQHAAGSGELQKLIGEAEREVDRLEEPKRRLERLRQEAFNAGLKLDREVAPLENELRDPAGWPRALRVLARDVERFREAWAPLVQAHEEINRITGEVRVTNLKDLERRQEAVALGVRMSLEFRDTLWKLDRAALHARIEEIRGELAKYDLLLGAADEDGKDQPEE